MKMNLISNIYKMIKRKFLNKILIVYSMIIVITVTTVGYIVSSSITNILETQSLSFNRQILEMVNQYFETKCSTVKQIHQQIIEDDYLHNQINNLVDYKENSLSDDYLSIRKYCEKAIIEKMGLDNDINHISFYKFDTNNFVTFTKPSRKLSNTSYSAGLFATAKSNTAEGLNYKKIFIYQAGTEVPTKQSYSFSLYDYIREPEDISRISSSILIDYNCEALKKSYATYSQYLKGNILVLSENNEVIFDSSDTYYDKPFPMSEFIKNGKNYNTHYEEGLINVITNNTFGYTTVGIIPYNELYKDINPLKQKIYIVSLISILFVIIFTYITTRIFSKQIQIVIKTIRRIQKGDLKTRITNHTEDEIGEISENLNSMCEKLSLHIEKEYITDLKMKDVELRHKEAVLHQKTAELYALQSQVNPHFLYNTLEVIRMKSLSLGESDVGKMIKILAMMFRNSIKDEMVVLIKDELEFCKSYLELYNIRYEGRLKFEFDISQEILNYGIIKHLLQPIIENSIIHGIDFEKEDNLVNVKAFLIDKDISIIISDNGNGMSKEVLESITGKLGCNPISTNDSIGIQNVNSRIKLVYGEEYGLSLSSQQNVGTLIMLKIAAKTKEELKSYVQSTNS